MLQVFASYASARGLPLSSPRPSPARGQGARAACSPHLALHAVICLALGCVLINGWMGSPLSGQSGPEGLIASISAFDPKLTLGRASADPDVSALGASVRFEADLCVALAGLPMTAAREQMSATLKDKARRCILQNLRSHRLGAEMLCRELGVSRSGLYRLLESEGGVAQYIQRLRLLESLAQLTDPSNRKPIAVIADELGLIDSSSFSRAFRRRLVARQVTPSVRDHAPAQSPAPAG